MKSSLKKLRGFGLNKSDARAKRSPRPSTQNEELVRATQDMQDMRNCYDSLLSAAAITTNTAYEFSESLRELGSCLLEKTALNDDEDSGRVLLMLGKAQYQIQKFIDSYRSHLSKTIISPSESLLNELQTVEEMKRQCDHKRTIYECMLESHKERAKSRNSRESVSPEKLQTAFEEYEDEAALFIFRLKSLKQGQSRSLLTQAIRHHAAQMNFFKKGFKFLELVDPQVKIVTEKQQIDYQFSALEEEDALEGDDESYDINDDGELSSDSEQPMQSADTIIPRQSMELDGADHLLLKTMPTEVTQANQVTNGSNVMSAPKDGSHSAPLVAYPSGMIDLTVNLKDGRPSTARKFNSYVLPTPDDTKSTAGGRDTGGQLRISGQSNPLYHSLPLVAKKETISYGTEASRTPHLSKSHSLLRESNVNDVTARASVHLGEGVSLRKSDWRNFDNKIGKQQTFVGPLTGKPWSTKVAASSDGSTISVEHSMLAPGMFTRVPASQPPHSSKLSPSSPPMMPSPKINELHELPRPPVGIAKNDISARNSLVAHSAPLVSRGQQRPLADKSSVKAMSTASPLPRPPATMPRSFSIPSRGSHKVDFTDFLELPSPLIDLKVVEVSSPPLTPIAFPNRSMPANTDTASRTTE